MGRSNSSGWTRLRVCHHHGPNPRHKRQTLTFLALLPLAHWEILKVKTCNMLHLGGTCANMAHANRRISEPIKKNVRSQRGHTGACLGTSTPAVVVREVGAGEKKKRDFTGS